MAEAAKPRVWTGRIIFLLLAMVLIFFKLLPLEIVHGETVYFEVQPDDPLPPPPFQWAMPDVLMAVILAWTVRRPDYVPVVSIAALLLLTDFLFQRPPGLWAALGLLLTEFLRARSLSMRALPFALEWATVSVGLFVITIVNRVVLALVDAPTAAIPLVATQMALTCLIYPIVVAIAHFVFRVSRPAPGEVDALGHRL